MKKKFAAFVLCVICLLSAAGCGQAKTDEQTPPTDQSAVTDDYLTTISGTYVELFPELSKSEYRNIWIDATTPLAGAENAETATDMLLGMCMAEPYGPEAAEKYAADPDSMAFNCYFLGGVDKFVMDGHTITGLDAQGQEVFSHTYKLLDEENENGFIFYQSEDENSGQFTYFAFSPDTMETTYHLEFRYGNALEAMSNEAVEYVRGIPVVKTFGQSVFSFKKFKTAIDEYEKWVVSYTKDLRLPMMFYTAAVNGVFAFLIAGGLLFTTHGVTPVFLLNLLFYIIITPVISLTLTRIMYMSENKMVVADALARIDSVLEAAPMQAQAVPQHPQDASVALQNVHFSYDGKNEVIKGVSLEIQPGQTVAFVGPSGGGKSTLANLVCRFFDVQSGSVRVGGADVRAIPKEELMDTISFVFQNSRLLKGSILDNVRLGRPQATEAEVLAALKAAQCMDIVEKFPAGIHTVIGTKGVYLSGGEQQRIAIARAMLKNAPILILDEATAFADPDNEAKVQAAFARLAKGKTVLMIAHRLSTVANADCIYVVQDGQIAESGTKDELCAQNGLFARMWQEYQASVQWKVAKEG